MMVGGQLEKIQERLASFLLQFTLLMSAEIVQLTGLNYSNQASHYHTFVISRCKKKVILRISGSPCGLSKGLMQDSTAKNICVVLLSSKHNHGYDHAAPEQ